MRDGNNAENFTGKIGTEAGSIQNTVVGWKNRNTDYRKESIYDGCREIIHCRTGNHNSIKQ